MDHGGWLTVAEAAALTEKPAVTIRRWAREHLIPAQKSGGVWLVRLQDVQEVIQGSLSSPPESFSEDLVSALTRAWRRVAFEAERDDIPDIIDYVDFGRSGVAEFAKLATEIDRGYRPRPFRIIEMPKNLFRSRPLAQLAIEDRVVYEACVQSIAPSIEARTHQHVYNHRLLKHPTPKQLVKHFSGTFAAFQKYVKSEAAKRTGAKFCLMTDIASFYEYIDHETLLSSQELRPDMQPVLDLLRILLAGWREQSIVIGLPQGPSTASGILCNSYLADVDSVASGGCLAYARFSDDMRLFFESVEDPRRFAPRLVAALRQLGLNLSVKTYVKSVEDLASDDQSDRRSYTQHMVDNGQAKSLTELRQIFDNAIRVPVDVNSTDFTFSLWRLGLLEDEYPLTRVLELLPLVPFAAGVVADYLARLGYHPDVKDALIAYLLSADNVHEWSEIHLLRLIGRFDEVPSQFLNHLRQLTESTVGVLGDFAARTLGAVGEPQDVLRLKRIAANRGLDPFRRRASILACAQLSEMHPTSIERLADPLEPAEVARAARFVVTGQEVPPTLVLRREPQWVAPLRMLLETTGELSPRGGLLKQSA